MKKYKPTKRCRVVGTDCQLCHFSAFIIIFLASLFDVFLLLQKQTYYYLRYKYNIYYTRQNHAHLGRQAAACAVATARIHLARGRRWTPAVCINKPTSWRRRWKIDVHAIYREILYGAQHVCVYVRDSHCTASKIDATICGTRVFSSGGTNIWQIFYTIILVTMSFVRHRYVTYDLIS